MFGPLNFGLTRDSTVSGNKYESDEDTFECMCLGCNDTFNISLCFDVFVKHMFEVHRLVVEDIQTIANIPEYMRWWRNKLNNRGIDCGLIPAVDMGDNTDRRYYFLSPLLKDDRQLRQRLQLEKILRTQEFDRTDTNYRKDCLVCRLQYEGTRLGYIEHLSVQHNFAFGKVQNLVYLEELVDRLEQKLKALQCIYCEKTFPDRAVLKEHMRKKGHKRIRAQDKQYDRFYIVNYVPKESSPTQQHNQDNVEATDENCDAEYADWVADANESDRITCLFCNERTFTVHEIERHMNNIHNFNLQRVMDELGEHYLRVKALNYIRRQVFRQACPCCGNECLTAHTLQDHLIETRHCQLPDDKTIYDRPEYFFSTYEDDALLYLIVDPDPEINESGDKTIAQLLHQTSLA